MLTFFLPPQLRARYGPLIHIALGVVFGVVGLFILTRILLLAAGVLVVWGLFGLVSRARHDGAPVSDHQDIPQS